MSDNIPIYSVVSHPKAGKTTLLEKLIAELKIRGLRVAVLKHDAHSFDIDHPGKDSWRMTQAGSDITAIISSTRAAIMENRALSIEEVLTRITDVDIILTEGYRYEPWPKIGIHRQVTGKPPIEIAGEYIVIMSDTDIEISAPVLDLNDIKSLADLLLQHSKN